MILQPYNAEWARWFVELRDAILAGISSPRCSPPRMRPPHHLYVCPSSSVELHRHLRIKETRARSFVEEAGRHGSMCREWPVAWDCGDRMGYTATRRAMPSLYGLPHGKPAEGLVTGNR